MHFLKISNTLPELGLTEHRDSRVKFSISKLVMLFISSISNASSALSMFPRAKTNFAEMTNLMFANVCISNNELDVSDSR
jgi:hypothetical protein